MGAGMSVVTLVGRLDECLIPSDRETIVDTMVQLERLLGFFKLTTIASKTFMKANGTAIMLRIMTNLLKDEVIQRVGFGIFEQQYKNREVILQLVKGGGLELLDKAIKHHTEDDYLRLELPVIRRRILAIAADAAIEEILRESISLQLCQRCQETMDRANRLETAVTMTKLPRSCERVQRVLYFMANYPRRKQVQKAGLDALLYFARNADALTQANEAPVIPVLANTVKVFRKDSDIMWRTFMTLALLSQISGYISSELTRFGIHESALEVYVLFEERESKVQQQVLWMLGSILLWPDSRMQVQTSDKCVDFFKARMAERDAHSKLKVKATAKAKDKKALMHVVVPHSIRKFMRDTKGEVIVVKSQERPITLKPPPKRKEVVQKPLFGTVYSEFYEKGDPGLV